ncbi:MAG TPA: BREX-2 system adenine-specific DNA-methyltransferase PglX [Lacunisphaera sp.]|nr:BREX-2 system adenine-specific DNA-methyltransferase PglX [Lacunisphaera sp.]
MAARKKKASPLSASTGTTDPRAPLDPAVFLSAAQPVLKALSTSLLARADASPAVTAALQARHAKEQELKRTADAYSEWRRAFADQVAAAWLLACVFVRTLEDRGLLGRARIAGSGAEDSWKAFLQIAPSLSEREYLLTVFRELSRLPAAADLFDAKHNPVWLLAPSADAARQLLDLFRSPSTEAPLFRFGGDDTRFLGDLYQDLSEDVRKRYALLQTPRFVESFILDRTLEPAIERFGLDETNLIDPTCGSGHFLLGAFERLFEHRLRAQPGLSAREAATKALDAVAGADINPYAVAIARFRLTLAFIAKCGFTRLKDVPRLPLHLAVADSLIYNPYIPQLALAPDAKPAEWEGDLFSFEDPKNAREVLFKQYAAVVGNPPYITVKDPALRERYRQDYTSAAGKYSLAAPFAERFFQAARAGGSVGMITANSFMKREFGKRLIEEYFKSVNLNLIINTSGAYIPGHGTPTVLLFGTPDKPQGSDVLTVLANRGEPSTPEAPEQGLVWTSIASHWNEVGFDNEYISVARTERKSIEHHPWSLGGGGAPELKELLEERAAQRLGDLAQSIGISCVTGEDEVYLLPPDVVSRREIGRTRPLVTGEYVRDWCLAAAGECVFPYTTDFTVLPVGSATRELKYLWPFRSILSKRKRFGTPMLERGLTWYELQELYADKLRTPLTITFAEVATHNHFVLDRGGKVFKQTAPIIKLPETATEDDHLAVLGYLNSSTACFWMKQVFYPKGSATRDAMTPENNRYAFAGTGMLAVPIPANWQNERLVQLARWTEHAALERARTTPDGVLANDTSWSDWSSLLAALAVAEKAGTALFGRLVFLQEELDWLVYRLFGLADSPSALTLEAIEPGERPFAWTSDLPPTTLPSSLRELYTERRRAIASSPELSLLESRTMKRLWRGTTGDSGRYGDSYDERLELAAGEWLADRLEKAAMRQTRVIRIRSLVGTLQDDERFRAVAEAFGGRRDGDLLDLVSAVVVRRSVPNLSCHTYTDSGLSKRAEWEAVWSMQRQADSGENVATISRPPEYSQGSRGKRTDFDRDEYWALRGPLDVPKERFISYPGCESDEDKEPVYGWAGWDHLQRAVALAGLYQDRKQREGWGKERLKPMLAGLLELLPWLKQWHNEPSAELAGERPSDQFEAFLNAECGEFGFTHDDLRAWRPATKGRANKKRSSSKAASADASAGKE